MIEYKRSKSNEVIFTVHGKHVCSSINVQGEAESWIHHNSEQLHMHDVIVVLGVGCGYHLKQLTRQFPKKTILVVDFNYDTQKACEEIHSLELAEVQFIVRQGTEEVMQHPLFQEYVRKGHFALVQFVPACVIDSALFQKLKDILVGRRPAQYQKLQELRPGLSSFLFAFDSKDESLLSIKNLTLLPSAEVKASTRFGFKILQELIV